MPPPLSVIALARRLPSSSTPPSIPVMPRADPLAATEYRKPSPFNARRIWVTIGREELLTIAGRAVIGRAPLWTVHSGQ